MLGQGKGDDARLVFRLRIPSIFIIVTDIDKRYLLCIMSSFIN